MATTSRDGRRRARFSVAAAWGALALVSVHAEAEDNWPRFRGPHGTGVAETGSPPDRWSETENVGWSTEIVRTQTKLYRITAAP